MIYGTLTYHTAQAGNRVELQMVNCYNLSNGQCVTFTGGTDRIIPKLTSCGIDCFFVLNGSHFFSFIDYYATLHNLPIYDTLKDDSGKRKKLLVEAWSFFDGEGATYNRKIWLKTALPNTRHKRVHAVSFINFSNMVAVDTVEELVEMVNLSINGRVYKDDAIAFGRCLQEFNKLYYRITGNEYLGPHNPASWTMGASARNYYLKLKFSQAQTLPLKLYHYAYPQNMKQEYFFRECKLLSGGLLYTKDRGILHEKKLFKYDKNSLFGKVERDMPALGILHKSNYEEYKRDKTGQFEYIFIIDFLELKAREGMPKLFSNPFKRYTHNADRIEITDKWAVFAPYLEILKEFYIIEDMEILSVYRAWKSEDAAIVRYVDNLYAYKRDAREKNQKGFANLVKFFLVNLHGKFAQKSVTVPKNMTLDKITNTVIKTYGEEIIDEWDRKHFDYVRGAYIYTMARVYIMKDILRFKEVLPEGETLEEHIFYDDTDSIITDLEAPSDMVDPYELGKLKLEETYTAFECIAPKTYWGRTVENEIKLTCAGMDKEEVFSFLRTNCNSFLNMNLNSNQYYHMHFTNKNILFPNTVLEPMSGGAGYVTHYRPLSTFDTDEIF